MHAFVTRYNDIDINGHFNSVKYIEHVLTPGLCVIGTELDVPRLSALFAPAETERSEKT